MMGNGQIIKLMERVLILISRVRNMKDFGEMTNRMDME